MVRYLALFIYCVIAVLAQVGPSMAHGGEPVLSLSQHGRIGTDLTTSPVDGQDCAPATSCCTALSAPCSLPLPPQQNGSVSAPRKSQPLTWRQDCLRSIILGRDPPIPRNRML
jgi:hypothetical protein